MLNSTRSRLPLPRIWTLVGLAALLTMLVAGCGGGSGTTAARETGGGVAAGGTANGAAAAGAGAKDQGEAGAASADAVAGSPGQAAAPGNPPDRGSDRAAGGDHSGTAVTGGGHGGPKQDVAGAPRSGLSRALGFDCSKSQVAKACRQLKKLIRQSSASVREYLPSAIAGAGASEGDAPAEASGSAGKGCAPGLPETICERIEKITGG